MKIFTKFLLVSILTIFLISFISAAATCYTETRSQDESYAKATICGEYVSPTATKGNGYKFYCTAGDLYEGNWDTCDENGCSNEAPSDPFIYYMSEGETIAKLEYTCYDYDSGSDGSWAWAAYSLFFRDATYKAPTGCASGTEKCTGTSRYVCESGIWKNKGVTIGYCNVECILDDICQITNAAPTIICEGNNKTQISTTSTCSANKCLSTESKTLIETCTDGCSNGICTPKVPDEPEAKGFALWFSLIINWFKELFK